MYVLPCHTDPIGWYGDKLEDEVLDTACILQAKFPRVKPSRHVLIEIPYQGRHGKEYGVLCHERLRQMTPAKVIVHLIEAIYCLRQHCLEQSHHRENTAKRCEFIRFYNYLCYVCQGFFSLYV